MPAPTSVVRRSIIGYLVLSVAVVAVLAAAAVVIGRRLALDVAVREAGVRTRMMADALAEPLVDSKVRAGDPDAVARLGRVLEYRMRDGSITHISVYDASGRVLWSDFRSIRRVRVGLAPDVRRLLGTNDTLIHRPDGREPHPWSRPGDARLIEVYAGARDSQGRPFVYEAYISPDLVDDDRDALLRALLPYVLGAVLLYLLATLPLAIRLARRVDRAASARSALVAQSVNALERQRHRVAQHLHDGVVQDLSATGYALTMLAEPVPGAERPDPRTRETARRLAALVQDDLHQLRSLLTDLVPSELAEGNLVSALGALRARSEERFGLHIEVEVAGIDGLEDHLAGVVFQVAREGLANIGRHARATVARVVVARSGDEVVVTVTDDGVGLAGAVDEVGDPSQDAHLGLYLLGLRVEEVGGHLELANLPEGGAQLRATLPLAEDDGG